MSLFNFSQVMLTHVSQQARNDCARKSIRACRESAKVVLFCAMFISCSQNHPQKTKQPDYNSKEFRDKLIEANKMYVKLGFVKEGVLRKHYFTNGKYEDKIIYSILNEEFNENSKEK
jgi:hypothetical protein